MKYIILETCNGPEYIMPIVDLETGLTKVFNSYEDAQKELSNCQDGIIVEIE